jgi:hypothetical protein
VTNPTIEGFWGRQGIGGSRVTSAAGGRRAVGCAGGVACRRGIRSEGHEQQRRRKVDEGVRRKKKVPPLGSRKRGPFDLRLTTPLIQNISLNM